VLAIEAESMDHARSQFVHRLANAPHPITSSGFSGNHGRHD
jgi:hypothetical protein